MDTLYLCSSTSQNNKTITFSPSFASIPKFGMGIQAMNFQTASETEWSIRLELLSISKDSAVINYACYKGSRFSLYEFYWIATISPNVEI